MSSRTQLGAEDGPARLAREVLSAVQRTRAFVAFRPAAESVSVSGRSTDTTVARRACFPENVGTVMPTTSVADGATNSESLLVPNGVRRRYPRSPSPASCARAAVSGQRRATSASCSDK